MLLSAIHRLRILGMGGLAATIRARIIRKQVLAKVARRDLKAPIFLRIPSSDAHAYEQVFVSRDYDFSVRRPPKVIVDAGANIGLTSIYLAAQHSEARVLAIEPEHSNFELLKINTAAYGNITPIFAALWDKCEELNVCEPSPGGWAKWAFQTRARTDTNEARGGICHRVMGMTVESIMREHGIDRIDILKMDIEGAEREVLRDASAWIGNVDALIIELHESIKPGCTACFCNATAGFDAEWRQGESVYVARNTGCLEPRKRQEPGQVRSNRS